MCIRDSSISASDSRIIAEKARGLRNLSMVKDLSVDKVSQSPVGNQLIADFNFLVDKSLL